MHASTEIETETGGKEERERETERTGKGEAYMRGGMAGGHCSSKRQIYVCGDGCADHDVRCGQERKKRQETGKEWMQWAVVVVVEQ